MSGRSDPYYISFEVDWASKTCPHCEQRTALGHGWLFKEPPPSSSALDNREPIGEVYIHNAGADIEQPYPAEI